MTLPAARFPAVGSGTEAAAGLRDPLGRPIRGLPSDARCCQMTLSLVYDLMILLSAGLIAALTCRRLKISILIGYLVVGAIVGHGVLGWVRDDDHQLAHFAEVGVFLLLFSIGLEFSIDDLNQLGRKLFIGGGTQMLLVATPVAAVLYGFGADWQSAVLIAAAMAFSSTVLVFRALSECGQVQQPHGRRAIGILLFQDAALVPLLLLVPMLTGGESTVGLAQYVVLGLTSSAFLVAVVGLRYALATWAIPQLANYRSAELVVLFTIVSLSGVTLAAYCVGLPPAVGAFAAGLIFNGNRWSHQIDALVLPFRETFAAVFFVGLGLIFDPQLVWHEPRLLLLLLPGVIVVKAFAAAVALKLTGLPTRTAVAMGIGLAHVGEFAFVLVLLGTDSGVLSERDYQRVVAIAVGSLILTPALIKAGLRWGISDGGPSEPSRARLAESSGTRQAVVIGAGPIGRSVASQLETTGKDVCLIDLSPINLHSFAQEGFRTVSGDATDPRVLALAELSDAGLVVVCVPDDGIALRVVRAIRTANPCGRLIVRCRFQSNIRQLKRAGSDEVVSEESEASLALLRLIASSETARGHSATPGNHAGK